MLTQNDFALFAALNRDAEVRQFLGGTHGLDSMKRDFAALLADSAVAAYVATLLENQDPIAIVLFGPHHDGRDTEVSYLLLPEYRGRGLAAEIVAAAIARCFEIHPELDRIVAETQAANQRSCAMLLRIGMTPVQRLIRFGADQVIYAKSRI
ncbi:MAG: hypothetical protein JWR51_1637 [Devosia sp.]|nr:hypothetical protein [Devosia sp.]